MRNTRQKENKITQLRNEVRKEEKQKKANVGVPKKVSHPDKGETVVQKQIAKLLKVQLRLKDTLNEYSALFEHSPAGYFILNKKGVIKNVNLRGAEQLGATKSDILHKAFSVFLYSDTDQQNFNSHMTLVVKNGTLERMQCEIKRKDGLVFTALIKSKVLRSEKRVFKHLLSIVTDISQLKGRENEIELQLKQAEELNTMKSGFIGMAAHEFRTPLTSMLSSATLIEHYLPTGDAGNIKKHLTRIKLSIKNLVAILDDFLSIEKLESGKVEIQLINFDLEGFCDDLLEEVAPIRKKGQVIRRQHNGDKEISADPKILRHIVLNLLSNGCKYSAEGQEIKLFTYVTNHEIKLIVQDNGIGIPDADQVSLFTRFFRAHNTDNVQGTGLGLHIVKRYVELLNGTIGFVSKPNEGTVFTVTFPQGSYSNLYTAKNM